MPSSSQARSRIQVSELHVEVVHHAVELVPGAAVGIIINSSGTADAACMQVVLSVTVRAISTNLDAHPPCKAWSTGPKWEWTFFGPKVARAQC